MSPAPSNPRAGTLLPPTIRFGEVAHTLAVREVACSLTGHEGEVALRLGDEGSSVVLTGTEEEVAGFVDCLANLISPAGRGFLPRHVA